MLYELKDGLDCTVVLMFCMVRLKGPQLYSNA